MIAAKPDLLTFFRALHDSKESLSDHEGSDHPYIPKAERIECEHQRPSIASKGGKKQLRREKTFDLNNRPIEIQEKAKRSFPDKRITTSAFEKFLQTLLEKQTQSETRPTRKNRIKCSSCDPYFAVGDLCLQKPINCILKADKKWVWPVKLQPFSMHFAYLGELQYIHTDTKNQKVISAGNPGRISIISSFH